MRGVSAHFGGLLLVGILISFAVSAAIPSTVFAQSSGGFLNGIINFLGNFYGELRNRGGQALGEPFNFTCTGPTSTPLNTTVTFTAIVHGRTDAAFLTYDWNTVNADPSHQQSTSSQFSTHFNTAGPKNV